MKIRREGKMSEAVNQFLLRKSKKRLKSKKSKRLRIC